MLSALRDHFRWYKFRRDCRRQMENFHRLDDPWRTASLVPRIEALLNSRLKGVHFQRAVEFGGGQGIMTPAYLQYCEKLDLVEISKRGMDKAELRLKTFEPHVTFVRRDLHHFYKGPQYDWLIFSFILDYLGYKQFPGRFTATLNALLAQGREGAKALVVNPVYSDEDRRRLETFGELFKRLGWRKEWSEEFGNEKDGVVAWGLSIG